MEIDYINGPISKQIFGMSRYQKEIHEKLPDVELNIIEYESLTRKIEKIYKSFFHEDHGDQVLQTNYFDNSNSKKNSKTNYKKANYKNNQNKHIKEPYYVNIVKNLANFIDRRHYVNIIRKKVTETNLKHVTSQELAYVLDSLNLTKTIVTCYDLIPWAYENNRSSYWKSNIVGLKNADTIITISEFSKHEIIKYLDYPSEKIEIIYPGVNHSSYKPINGKIELGLKLPDNCKTVLYVGSEEPRQNLPTLLKAFQKLKMDFPNVKLLKIGNPHLYGARNYILRLIKELNLEKDVIFVGYVPEEQLPLWYNTADISVYPCLYAGFGLPPLEAMACGTPVITSNTTSIPEVVKDAGIMLDPLDTEVWANNMHDLLTDPHLRGELVKKGIERSKLFDWQNSAKKTYELYKKMDI